MSQLMRKYAIKTKSITAKQICPVTQQVINTPFTNICGHIIEREEAKKISLKSDKRCPHFGCDKKISFK